MPLVVRLEGTNVEQGKDILANSGLPIVAADDLGDAAQKIVAEVKAGGLTSPRHAGVQARIPRRTRWIRPSPDDAEESRA